MNVSILNALWSILVGEKLDLDDPKLAEIIQMIDYLLREVDNPGSAAFAVLPHLSMAKWPGIRTLTGFDAAQKTFRKTSLSHTSWSTNKAWIRTIFATLWTSCFVKLKTQQIQSQAFMAKQVQVLLFKISILTKSST